MAASWVAGLRRFGAIGMTVMLVIVAACGSSDDDDGEVEAGDVIVRDAVPEDLDISSVAVNEQEGWVVARQPGGGRFGPYDLWRLVPGEASLVGELPALTAMGTTGSEFGLTVDGVRCSTGGVEDCEDHIAVAIQIDHEGNTIREITLWEEQGAIGDGGGAGMIGEAAGLTWLRIHPDLTSIDPDGNLDEIPDPGGLVCVVDDQLHSIRSSEAPPLEVTDELTTEDSGQATETYSVLAYGDGSWGPVDDGEHEVAGAVRPSASCVGDRIEIYDRSGVGPRLAWWSPDDGWAPVDASVESVPEGTEPTTIDDAGTFVVATDGAVLEQAVDGEFDPTGLDLAPPRLGGVPNLPRIDVSESLVLGCVIGREGTPTVCDVVERE